MDHGLDYISVDLARALIGLYSHIVVMDESSRHRYLEVIGTEHDGTAFSSEIGTSRAHEERLVPGRKARQTGKTGKLVSTASVAIARCPSQRTVQAHGASHYQARWRSFTGPSTGAPATASAGDCSGSKTSHGRSHRAAGAAMRLKCRAKPESQIERSGDGRVSDGPWPVRRRSYASRSHRASSGSRWAYGSGAGRTASRLIHFTLLIPGLHRKSPRGSRGLLGLVRPRLLEGIVLPDGRSDGGRRLGGLFGREPTVSRPTRPATAKARAGEVKMATETRAVLERAGKAETPVGRRTEV